MLDGVFLRSGLVFDCSCRRSRLHFVFLHFEEFGVALIIKGWEYRGWMDGCGKEELDVNVHCIWMMGGVTLCVYQMHLSAFY